ncbi:hypothetical protein VQ643_00060 [Pseudomonas sp. F1_0610]|uniref:hypothetical protein n=1 Tax=Pseudomonas sp. F1_0610 TaxID=3114284 RepID=UPI0039C0C964
MTSKEILGAICASIVIILFAYKNNKTETDLTHSSSPANWQASAKKSDPFIAISTAQLIKESNKGANMILFVSSDNCGYSRQFEPALRSYLKANSLQVGNLNLSKERGYIDFNGLKAILGERAGATPSVYAIQNGKVSERLLDRDNPQVVDDFFRRNAYLMQFSQSVEE